VSWLARFDELDRLDEPDRQFLDSEIDTNPPNETDIETIIAGTQTINESLIDVLGPNRDEGALGLNALLGAVALLGREHADPILQEFFDRVNPLAIEAERRVWQAEDAYRAGVEGADEMVREAGKVLRAMRGGRAQAVNLALELESPIFVDDITAMLFRNDPAARVGGAEFAGYYIPHFAADRPDAVAKARAGAAALFASDNPRVARAGRRLLERLDKELGPEKAPDGPLPPAPVEKDAPD